MTRRKSSERDRAMRRIRAIVAATGLALAACTAGPGDDAAPSIVHVPADAPTITAALDLADAGDMILVRPGVYREAVVVETPDVTIRGTDRNDVVIDGQGQRAVGIFAVADGVRVQNLTTTAHTLSGVLISGVHDAEGNAAEDLYRVSEPEAEFLQRYEVRNVTSSNNGLYGLYVFHAQHGAIIDSYASGAADSGFYLGQCVDCDAVISGNIGQRNAIGFENANASGDVLITGNRFADNRVGMTLTSDYQEAFVPQRRNHVVGNVIADNSEPDSPLQADGGFGIGIGIGGGQENLIERNVITGNPHAGVLLAGAEDVPAKDNQLVENVFGDNGVDLADVSTSRAQSSGTCVVDNQLTSAQPAVIAQANCPTGTPQSAGVELAPMDAPPGVPYLDVTLPSAQPGLAQVEDLPDRLPNSPSRPAIADIMLPDHQLLAAQTPQRGERLSLDQAATLANSLYNTFTTQGAEFTITLPADGAALRGRGVVDWAGHRGHMTFADNTELFWDDSGVFVPTADATLWAYARADMDDPLHRAIAIITGLASRSQDNPALVQQGNARWLGEDTSSGEKLDAFAQGGGLTIWVDDAGRVRQAKAHVSELEGDVQIDIDTFGPREIALPTPNF